MELFATTAWYIWCRRNKMRVSEPVVPMSSVAGEAYQYLATYQSGQPRPVRLAKRKNIKWKPPSTGMYKTNFDNAVFEESGEAGIGVIIRNSRGKVMASLAEKILKPSSVETVELLAARRAVILVQELGFKNSIFEGDSETVINSLRNGDRLKSFIGHLVQDTLSDVNSLRSWSFFHIGRQDNAVAHVLAKRARLSFILIFG
ncbi:hypothetical protein SO802_012798 [Lithocarpus litseifolius]|uniref:RNase H type-1 domain-containing protein n=1 Tax=Lithocarpus litseifolius TaxID=425828 RepID=A0AAW2D5Z4_9ROSI